MVNVVDILSILLIIIVLVSSLWIFYNIPAFVVGFHQWVRKRTDRNSDPADPHEDFEPKVSVIVPVRNEENVLERLLKALVDQDYPQKEIVLVEDGSTDRTPEICQTWAERYPSLIKYVHSGSCSGKPSAINFAAKRATGEIIAVYDADTVLEPDALRKLTSSFKDPNVAAVQGELRTINPDESLITRLSVINDFIVNMQQLGKDKLDTFVPLLGTNQFIRRSVLEDIGYWDSEALGEDTEISVKLARRGYKVKYVPGTTGVEAPAEVRIFMRQRMKWLRGYTQTLMKHRGMLRTPSYRTIDACLTLVFPVMLILGLVGYLWTLFCAFQAPSAVPILQVVGIVLLAANLLTPIMFVSANPRKAIYVPLIYLDWILLSLVSLYVHARALLGLPQEWTRTPKSGHVTNKTD